MPRTSSKSATKPQAVKKAAAPKAPAAGAVFNKTQILAHISQETGLSRKQVVTVFDSLAELIERHLKKRGPGRFSLLNLFKCYVVRKPATKERKGINPLTGLETTFKAKPARNVVRVRPLKRLKAMVE